MQLELFQGEHVPLLRCHVALDRGDLRDARAALAEAGVRAPEAPLVERIAELEAQLARAAVASDRAGAVHAAFEATLAEAESAQGHRPAQRPARSAPGGPGARDWFRLYAAHMAEALATEPTRRVRGWCALHFELAVGRSQCALRAAERQAAACSARDAGWAWLEAARAAYAASEPERALRFALVACLAADEGLACEPPALAPVPPAALNGSATLLPRLPVELEELWTEAELLELPPPASAWVPALGILAGVFAPALVRSAEVCAASGFDAEADPPPAEPATRGFVRALLAARAARSQADPFRAEACGEAELRARARMRALAPALLARYLEGLAGLRPGA